MAVSQKKDLYAKLAKLSNAGELHLPLRRYLAGLTAEADFLSLGGLWWTMNFPNPFILR